MKKIYYQMIFEQTSPLRIGNGQHEESDSDLMLDGRGLPFIPGTSLAGIIKHRATVNGIGKDVEARLFGMMEIATEGKREAKHSPSAILIGDAVLEEGVTDKKVVFGRRDGIGLKEEWGSVKEKAKFDFQISETGSKFCSVVEWEGDAEQEKKEIDNVIEPIMQHFAAVGIAVGARTTRGYGKFTVVIKKKQFDFPNDLDTWLNFDPYAAEAFQDGVVIAGQRGDLEDEVEISFKMTNSFSVRVNTARKELAEDGSVPDSVPMENAKGKPVVPGTVWAGVFRHHMHGLLRDTGVMERSGEKKTAQMLEVDALFGMDEVNGHKKSQIIFSESEIEVKKEQKISVMRTAVERFTASPRNTALFTNMVYYGGSGVLRISFNKSLENKYRELLAACICDMHLGLLTVGGEASVGRGLMQITGLKFNECDVFESMKASADGHGDLKWLKVKEEAHA